jgi:tRNA(Ile2) C34 agmatinyltransferase TiaS
MVERGEVLTQERAETLRNDKLFCPDCGASCQRTTEGWRCPWATSGSRRTAWVETERVSSCGAPYERPRELHLTPEEKSR